MIIFNRFGINIIFLSLFALILSALLEVKIRGLYIGVILSVLMLSTIKLRALPLKFILYSVLILNLFIVSLNTFFFDYYSIAPLWTSGENLEFNKNIIRYVNIFGYDFFLSRRTGIIDNIHVTSLLLLFLIYISKETQKRMLFFFTSAILFLGVNFQYIIIYLVWLYIRTSNRRFNIVTFLKLLLGFTIIFFIIDHFVSESSYAAMIFGTGIDYLSWAVNTYIEHVSFKEILFGMPAGTLDLYDVVQYGAGIPLDDIGVVGLLIHYGLVGVCMIIMWISYILIAAQKNERQFVIILLFSAIHYFNIVSFAGIFLLTLIIIVPKYYSVDLTYKGLQSKSV